MNAYSEIRSEMEGHLGVILLNVRRLELLLKKQDAMLLALKKVMEPAPLTHEQATEPNPLLQGLPMVEAPAGSTHVYDVRTPMPPLSDHDREALS